MLLADIIAPIIRADAELISAGAASGDGGQLVDVDELAAHLRTSSAVKVASQVFNLEVTTQLSIASATIVMIQGILRPLMARSGLSQTEAYWMVDVWGRKEALKAHLLELVNYLDSGRHADLIPASLRSRISVLVFGCEEALGLVGAQLLAELPSGLQDLIARVRAALPAAQAEIVAHRSDS